MTISDLLIIMAEKLVVVDDGIVSSSEELVLKYGIVILNSSSIPLRSLSFNLAFTILIISSGGPPQSMYAIRSPADNVVTTAATISSQYVSVKGEISPISTPSSSTAATEVWSASEIEMAFSAFDAGEW
ncbi:hypothetical protein E3N88_34730 [Mikania micrantha]|uniref:Uncharacterized protein n=1 Tax=Mikania micrantha TaxID=192012 RepID=A0A5N6LYZ2_9ASTR|nr:hypothetical protein E3N88_34730 [Mikania micrantha]